MKLKLFVWILSRYDFVVSYSVFPFQEFCDITKGVESIQMFRVVVKLYFILSV